MFKNIHKIVFLTIFLLNNCSIQAQESADQASAPRSVVKPLSPSSQNPQQNPPRDIVWANRISQLSYGAAFVAHLWNLGQWYKGAPASSKKVWSLAEFAQAQTQGLERHPNQTKSTLQERFPNSSDHFDPITWAALGDQQFTLWKQADSIIADDSADSTLGVSPIIAYVQLGNKFWQLNLEQPLLTKNGMLLEGGATILGAAIHAYCHKKYNSTVATFMDLAIIPGLFSIVSHSTPLVKGLTCLGAIAQAYGVYREHQVQQQG